MRLITAGVIGGLTLAADQLTKLLVASQLAPGESLPLIPPALYLTCVRNTGAAFGLFKGQQLLFIGLAALVMAWMIRELLAKPSLPAPSIWACALILGGAAGNLLDRARFGYVVDFIDLRIWPVFNIGDSAITIGVALLLWQAVRHR